MLDAKAYREKKARYERYEKEFHEEEALWEAEMLKLANTCRWHGFLPVLGNDGRYTFPDHCACFCPGRYMDRNTLDITEDAVSMTGWDMDGDQVGFMKVRIADLSRKGRGAYFLGLYEEVCRDEREKKAREQDKKERALYERLKAKYETEG